VSSLGTEGFTLRDCAMKSLSSLESAMFSPSSRFPLFVQRLFQNRFDPFAADIEHELDVALDVPAQNVTKIQWGKSLMHLRYTTAQSQSTKGAAAPPINPLMIFDVVVSGVS